MDIEAVKRTVLRIKTQLFKNSNTYSIGMLKSHFRGSGLQFKEHQIYCAGDDVRFIDWKIVAKTGVPYIKTFDEERNVEIVVMIDASSTMLSGFNGVSKLQASIEICCLLYLLAKETGDFVHAIIVSDGIINIRKLAGYEGVVNLISVLQKNHIINENGMVNISRKIDKQTSSREKINILMKHLSKRREIVLLSDFNDFFDVMTLKRMIYRSNVHCFQIMSPLDEAEKTPYLMYCDKNGDGKGRRSMNQVNFYHKDEFKGPFGKKFKRLKVHERYLEEFVKEML